MMDRLRTRLDAGRQDGFTLIELLIVIVILGVLAGIVVFAVGGITDRGEKAACKSDYKTIQVAQEAHFAQNKAYAASTTALKPKYLADVSTLYTTAISGDTYTITPTAAGTAQGCTSPPA